MSVLLRERVQNVSLIKTLLVAVLAVSGNARADIPAAERERAMSEAMEIVGGVNSAALSLGASYDQSRNPQFQDAEIVINIGSKSLLSRLHDGFRTLHQTGTTNGNSEPEKRLKIESAFAGRQFTSTFAAGSGGNVMPKYGYAIFPGENEVSHFGDYGDIFIVLKEAVKKRATWSPSDSFDFADDITARTTQKDLIRQGHLNTFTAGKINPGIGGRYFEAQIWGPIDSKSVAEIVFPRNYAPPVWMYPHVEAVFRKLVAMGLAISFFEAIPEDGVGVSQFEPFLARTKLPAGTYPSAIQIVSPEEVRAEYLRLLGFPLEEPTAEEIADNHRREQNLLEYLSR